MVRFRNYLDHNSINNFICHCYTIFALLYSMEEVLEPQMTVKVIANNGIGLTSMVIRFRMG